MKVSDIDGLLTKVILLPVYLGSGSGAETVEFMGNTGAFFVGNDDPKELGRLFLVKRFLYGRPYHKETSPLICSTNQ